MKEKGVNVVAKRKSDDSRIKIDPDRVLDLASKGLTQAEIAKLEGVAPSTISRFLEKNTPEAKALELFETNRPRFLVEFQRRSIEMQLKILEELDKRGVDRMTINDLKSTLHTLVVTSGIQVDKERLLTGKSTSNNLLFVAQKAVDDKIRNG